MAYLEDYNEDERRLQQESSGPGQSYAPAATGSAPSSAAPASSGMTPAPIAAYFTANEPAAQQMATDVGTRVEQAGRDAVQSWDAGKAQDAWGRAGQLGTQEGVATELHNAYRDPLYTSGMADLDAYVTRRGSKPGQYDELVKRFSDLDPSVVGTAAPTAPDAPHGVNLGDLHMYESDPAKAKRLAEVAKYDSDVDQYRDQANAWGASRHPFLEAFGLTDPLQDPVGWRPNPRKSNEPFGPAGESTVSRYYG